jgi:hypothetical protein
MTTQLLDLALNEISGVDHPASLVEGWLVQKTANPDPISAALVEAFAEPERDSMSALQIEVDEPTSDEANADIAKALADIQKELSDARSERDSFRKERDDLTETVEVEKAAARVAEWSHLPGIDADAFVPVLRSLDAEHADTLTAILDAANTALAAVEKSVTAELGSTADGNADDLEAVAKAKVADGTYSNFHEAIAAEALANPHAYNRKEA